MGFPKLVKCVDDEDALYADGFLVAGVNYIATGVEHGSDFVIDGTAYSWDMNRFVVLEEDYQVPQDVAPEEYTGASVSYYKLTITERIDPEAEPCEIECQEVIEALGMDFAEGNAFKAIWRKCAARKFGKAKKGYDNGLYDAEKVVFFGQRMLALAKAYADKLE